MGFRVEGFSRQHYTSAQSARVACPKRPSPFWFPGHEYILVVYVDPLLGGAGDLVSKVVSRVIIWGSSI